MIYMHNLQICILDNARWSLKPWWIQAWKLCCRQHIIVRILPLGQGHQMLNDTTTRCSSEGSEMPETWRLCHSNQHNFSFANKNLCESAMWYHLQNPKNTIIPILLPTSFSLRKITTALIICTTRETDVRWHRQPTSHKPTAWQTITQMQNQLKTRKHNNKTLPRTVILPFTRIRVSMLLPWPSSRADKIRRNLTANGVIPLMNPRTNLLSARNWFRSARFRELSIQLVSQALFHKLCFTINRHGK